MSAESIALTEAVYYIPLSRHAPLHGYGIIQKVTNLSSGRVRLAAGTLYGAINAMFEKGWISVLPGGKIAAKKNILSLRRGKTSPQTN